MKCDNCCGNHRGGINENLYGMGVIGAAIYFGSGAVGFWAILVGITKAFFWPAFLVYKAMGMMGI